MTDTFEPNIIEWTWGTKELVKGEIGADVALGSDQEDFQIRVWPLDWQDANWTGVEGQTRTFRSQAHVDSAELDRTIRHSVYARFSDSLEEPIIFLGQIQLNY